MSGLQHPLLVPYLTLASQCLADPLIMTKPIQVGGCESSQVYTKAPIISDYICCHSVEPTAVRSNASKCGCRGFR
jgi:hypothetical protein